MCGRLPDADVALTALSYASQIVFLLMVAMIGLTVGSVALVSRAHGAGDPDRVNHVLEQSTILTVAMAILTAALGNLFAPWLLMALAAEGPSLEAGLAYLRPLLLGSPFYYLSILYAAVLRGVGNTALAFRVALVSNAVNVVLNYGFILGNLGFPALGVRGAAFGTVIAYATSVGLMVYALNRGAIEGLKVRMPRPNRLDGPLLYELWGIGAPAAADMVILNAGFIAIVGMLGRLDEIAVAAHGVGIRVQALAFVPGMSISQAAAAMIGNALGAGDRAEADRIVKAGVAMCTAAMVSLGALFILAATPIVQIFDVQPHTELMRYSVRWMEILGIAMLPVGIWIGFAGMLGGSGATGTSLRIQAVTTLGIQIPVGYVLGYTLDLGPAGVWLGLPIAFTFKALLGFVAWRSGRWARTGVRLE